MRRVGRTYKVIGFFNPLGICYPAQVVPVYRLHNDTSERRKLYLQIRDESGIVEDFQEVPDTNQNIVQISGGKMNGVDQPAMYGFAFSNEKALFVKGLAEYREFLTDALKGRHRRFISSKPIAGVEMARLIEDERLEAVFVSMAVVKLSRAGGSVARGWLKSAPLSKLARERGYRSLERLEGRDKNKVEVIEVITTIVISDHTHIQGDLIWIFDDGQVEVRFGGTHYRGWPTWNTRRLPLEYIVEFEEFVKWGGRSAVRIASILKAVNPNSDLYRKVRHILHESINSSKY